jgi:hypothetical protein
MFFAEEESMRSKRSNSALRLLRDEEKDEEIELSDLPRRSPRAYPRKVPRLAEPQLAPYTRSNLVSGDAVLKLQKRSVQM